MIFLAPFLVYLKLEELHSTLVKIYMIEEHYYWQQHPLMLHNAIHIHECIYETSLIHLKSSCFLCSLFCSDFGGGSPFTYGMKEHIDDY